MRGRRVKGRESEKTTERGREALDLDPFPPLLRPAKQATQGKERQETPPDDLHCTRTELRTL